MAFTRIGFGQVEPNQLSAQKTGQIYASLPLDENVKVLHAALSQGIRNHLMIIAQEK